MASSSPSAAESAVGVRNWPVLAVPAGELRAVAREQLERRVSASPGLPSASKRARHVCSDCRDVLYWAATCVIDALASATRTA